MLDRAYGEVGNFKDGPSTYLMPGEKPRKAYQYPTDLICPKCEKSCFGAREKNNDYHCTFCGTLIPEPDNDMMIISEEFKKQEGHIAAGLYERKSHMVVCSTEGCNERFLSKCYNRAVYCPSCRENRLREGKRKYGEKHRKWRRDESGLHI